ncbi:MAG: transposase [Chloroflexi bacterium]|nr:transposase [Chloroflexota bacterium]
MFTLWHQSRDGTATRAAFQTACNHCQEIEALLELTTLLVPHRQTQATCRNLLRHKAALWRFVDHEGVEPTNNAAEQALRRGVLWRKRSFGTQSQAGSRFCGTSLDGGYFPASPASSCPWFFWRPAGALWFRSCPLPSLCRNSSTDLFSACLNHN